ncbi:hypothetical protein B0H13DRAFT_1868766 [Mycena leptocephala]|nr:hypothetical protein B0H13DRAFT_1868766 [Mycena leptocephala]
MNVPPLIFACGSGERPAQIIGERKAGGNSRLSGPIQHGLPVHATGLSMNMPEGKCSRVVVDPHELQVCQEDPRVVLVSVKSEDRSNGRDWGDGGGRGASTLSGEDLPLLDENKDRGVDGIRSDGERGMDDSGSEGHLRVDYIAQMVSALKQLTVFQSSIIPIRWRRFSRVRASDSKVKDGSLSCSSSSTVLCTFVSRNIIEGPAVDLYASVDPKKGIRLEQMEDGSEEDQDVGCAPANQEKLGAKVPDLISVSPTFTEEEKERKDRRHGQSWGDAPWHETGVDKTKKNWKVEWTTIGIEFDKGRGEDDMWR